ncbi:MAG: hypothetical protein FWF53_11105 [Candidatus Azobacteroides sp.]|nr:hypothetical protein [Candidatus Azobacteroides sp.]
MKNFIQYISLGFFCIIVFSCNNDFLSKVPEISSLTATSEIIVLPNGESKDYSVRVPTVGAAGFKVVEFPDWLNVYTKSGQFSDDVATINCAASVRNEFSGTGVYKSSIVLNIEGYGNILIPVSYVTEGNPAIEVESNLAFQYSVYYNNGNASLVIRNGGEGVLLWSFAEMSDWISVNNPGKIFDSTNNYTFMILPFEESVIDLSCSIESFVSPDAQGKIVIRSNDKNNGETTINVSCDLGDPILGCSNNRLDFGQTDVTRLLNIYNGQGNGLLTWKIDSCPEWLSVSEMDGFLPPLSLRTLLFTCDRSQLPDGELSHTIYLLTNDKNNPSYAITVTVDNSTWGTGE